MSSAITSLSNFVSVRSVSPAAGSGAKMQPCASSVISKPSFLTSMLLILAPFVARNLVLTEAKEPLRVTGTLISVFSVV